MSRIRLFLIALTVAIGAVVYVWQMPCEHAPASAPDDVQVYILWKPSEDAPMEKATGESPIAGSVVIRAVVPGDSPTNAELVSATITELKNKVHATRPVDLRAAFRRESPDPKWGDPGSGVVFSSSPIPTADYHNMPHDIEIAIKTTPDGPALRGGKRILFKSLLLEDTTKPRWVVAWDPANPKPVTFSCRLQHAQTGKCAVKYEVFQSVDNERPVAGSVVKGVSRVGAHTWIWNGKKSDGKEADPDLYTYRITAFIEESGKTVDSDFNRSSYLRIARAVDPSGQTPPGLDFLGMNYLGILNRVIPLCHSYANHYSLVDSTGKSALSVEQWFYDVELKLQMKWDSSDLECQWHSKKPDGCKASAKGVSHVLVVSIPDKNLQYAGTFCVITHALDSHADRYKDHKPKPALELN